MTTLVPIDGSHSSFEAAKYAALSRPDGEVLLLYVAPSGRPVDLERGRFLLREGQRNCQAHSQDARIDTRLEIGDPRVKIPEVAAAVACDLVVIGAYGVNSLPHVDQVGQGAAEWTGEIRSPVVLVLPTGEGITAGGEDRAAPWARSGEPLAGTAA
jgi:nucleotide-binding universal stress UspA family protein